MRLPGFVFLFLVAVLTVFVLTLLQQREAHQPDTVPILPSQTFLWSKPGALFFLSEHASAIEALVSPRRTADQPLVVCIVGSVDLAAQLLRVFRSDATLVFFDPTPVAGNHSGVFTVKMPLADGRIRSPVQLLRYVGHPHFGVRRFMSEFPSRKCNAVLLDDSVKPENVAKPQRLMQYLAAHTWHLSTELQHVVVADRAWGAALWVRETLSSAASCGRLPAALTPSPAADDGAAVGCFLHRMPYPRSDLAKVLESGSWTAVDLKPYDELGAALQSAAKAIEYWTEGHSGEITLERKLYAAIAGLPGIRTICEIGFNAGHSASLWLRAAPTARVVMFDLFEHKYSRPMETFLRERGREYGLSDVNTRLTTINGSSIVTVPQFAQDHPNVQCDVLSVDGGHFGEIPMLDLQNMHRLANKQWHVVVVDDTNCDGSGCIDDRIDVMRSLGQLEVLARVSEAFDYDPANDGSQMFRRGVTVLQYTTAYLAT
jgi:hypothetical protein